MITDRLYLIYLATTLLGRSLLSVSRVVFKRVILRQKALLPSWPVKYEATVAAVRSFCNQMKRPGPHFSPVGPTHPFVTGRIAISRPYAGVKETASHPTMEEHRPLRHKNVKDSNEVIRLMTEEGLLLYFHGGGYTTLSPANYRNLVGRLCIASGAWALVPDYPLSPQSPYPAALNYVIGVYKEIVASGVPATSITVGGDSAGGNLAMAFMMRIREMGMPLPRKVVLLSPWADMSAGDFVPPAGAVGERKTKYPSYTTNAPYDILDPTAIGTVANMYAPNVDKTNPLISPVYADFSTTAAPFPPTYIQAGGAEVFRDEDRLLAEKMKSGGVEVVYDEMPEMVHDSQMFADMHPVPAEGIERLGAFIRMQ